MCDWSSSVFSDILPTVQKASSALKQLKMSPWWTVLHMLVIRVVTWVHVEIDPWITMTLMVRIYPGINRVIVYLAGQSQRDGGPD